MNRLYTALIRPRYDQLRYAIAIVTGYSVGGFYLSSAQVGNAIWGLICLLVAYVATTGMGGIVLTQACFSSMVIVYAFSHPWPTTTAIPTIPVTPAQVWSGTLLIYWMLGSLLIALLASAITEFTQKRRFHWRYTLFLIGLSTLSLNVGHRLHALYHTS